MNIYHVLTEFKILAVKEHVRKYYPSYRDHYQTDLKKYQVKSRCEASKFNGFGVIMLAGHCGLTRSFGYSYKYKNKRRLIH